MHAEGPQAALEERRKYWETVWGGGAECRPVVSPRLQKVKHLLRRQLELNPFPKLPRPLLRRANQRVPVGKATGQDGLDPLFIRGSRKVFIITPVSTCTCS